MQGMAWVGVRRWPWIALVVACLAWAPWAQAASVTEAVQKARASRSLDEVLALLFSTQGPLPEGEREVVERALALTPVAREDLRARLTARQLLADPRAAKKAGRTRAELLALRPYASPFRVAALLPDSGDYAEYGATLRTALAAGIAGAQPRLELVAHGTGDDDAPRTAAALDTASQECALVVGELLSVPTRALATATRFMGMPLVSPSATDESIGRIGPAVFQVGPAQRERAFALAQVMFAGKARRFAIVASQPAMRGELVKAFSARAESLGARLVRREPYAHGNTDFRMIARSVRAAGAEVLLWDGEPREAEALVRSLATEGVSVRLCGGENLAPDQYHASGRTLLEGVVYVGEDWRLPAAEQARLDSLARSAGSKPGALWNRGYLAGRRIAAAVAAGARTPNELAARLRHRDGALRAAGMLDCALDGARLPVFSVQRGRSVELSARTD